MSKARENDPAHEALVAVLLQWKEHLGIGSAYTVQEVIARAVNSPTFYAALMNVAASKTGATVSNDRLVVGSNRSMARSAMALSCSALASVSGYPIWSLRS